MAENQQNLQNLSQSLQKIQDDLQSTISARQTLEAQAAENIAVQKEFRSLSDSANIYKLVGPVLVKQDRAEANSAVDGRLEYINKEITRTEKKIQDLQADSEKKRIDLMGLQQKMQLASQGQSAA